MNDANSKTKNYKNIQDLKTAEKIEQLIRQKYNITIPSLIFEYLSNENMDFEVNDLKTFYSQFGDIVDFIIKDKLSIVLYKTFFSAECCKEFLSNENNFRDNMKKNFTIKWFKYEKDMNLLPPEMEQIFETIHNHNHNTKDNSMKKIITPLHTNSDSSKENSSLEKQSTATSDVLGRDMGIGINNQKNQNPNLFYMNGNSNQNPNNIYLSPNYMLQYNQLKMNQGNNINSINNLPKNMQNLPPMSNYGGIQNNMIPSQMNIPLFMNQNLNGMNNLMGMQMNCLQYHQNQFNQNLEEKNYGKYTCKYEILIPNDKDFQVARRLIGSKGYNMKKILSECKQNNNINDNIKLRLRGKGSGYKEGPQNKESEEPLHLCISTKNLEEMDMACGLVDELLNKIYDEYKKFCINNNISPILPKIANKIDCGNSLHKAK